jgi:hypothetical protein
MRADDDHTDLAQHFSSLFATYETARKAYGALLTKGCERPDTELARDPAYNELLAAGMALYQIGGPSAVDAAAKRIGAIHPTRGGSHFLRLWHGLMPEPDYLNSVCRIN